MLKVYRSVIKKSLPFLFISILIFIFFRRLFFPQSSLFMIPDFGESDVLHLNLPLKEILSTSLKSGQWPLWTPYLASGFPLLAEGQIGTFYLPNLLFFRFMPTVTAYNLNLVLAFFLSAIGYFIFAQSIGLSSVPATFAAIVFTFSGFLSVHLNHFNLIQAASLLPLLFWASNRLANKPSIGNTVLFSFLLTEQIFTGHFYIVFITLIGILIFFAINRYQIRRLAIGLFLTFLLGSIQLFPTIELQQKSARAGGLDFDTVTSYPYPPKHLLTFINPYAFGSPANGSYPAFNDNWGIFWENTAYIGILPLVFAGLSLIYIKEKWVKTSFVLFFLSLLLVLGKYSPIYFVFSIPPFSFFRVPSKFLLLTVFSLTLLSALMVEKIIRKLKVRFVAVLFIALLFTLIITDEFYFSYNYPPVTPSSWWTDYPQTAEYLSAKEGRIVSIGASTLWNSVFVKNGWQDMSPYVYFRNSLYPNYNAIFKIPNIDINTGGLIPKRTSLMMSLNQEIKIDEKEQIALVSTASANALSLQNTNYLISAYRIINPVFQKLGEVDFIYKNSQSLPRAYIAYKSRLINTTGDFYREVSKNDFLKETTVLVENDKFLIEEKGDPSGKVRITDATSLKVTLETESSSAGILVFTDSFYPGWKAYLDTKETEIFVVNLNQRGIIIPPGKHEVNFVFKSFSFTLGKIVTIISALIVFGVLSLYYVFFPRKAYGNKKPWHYH